MIARPIETPAYAVHHTGAKKPHKIAGKLNLDTAAVYAAPVEGSAAAAAAPAPGGAGQVQLAPR